MNKNLLEELVKLIEKSKTVGPTKHGEFNRLMFVDAMFNVAGSGCSISSGDIISHGGMTQKEFDTISAELLSSNVIKKEVAFGHTMYRFNFDSIEALQ